MSDNVEMDLTCRGLGWADGLVDGGTFPLPGDNPRYARDKTVDIKHVRLDVALDLQAGRIRGSVAHTLAPINEGVTSIELDAVGLEIRGAHLSDGRPLGHTLSEGRLRVDLGRAAAGGEDLTLVVDFAGSPRRGLYFIRPDDAYPNKRVEAWTQGQDEDSRHWFPCYDYPNEMATSEIHVTVPEPYTTIANGELTSLDPGPEPGTRTFHWRQTVPHVTYLTSVCVGEFGEVRDEWDGIPVTYHVAPGREDDAREIFKNTPEMVRLFSERTGVRYPYAKYAQVVVQDFIFGGMENVSATTLTDTVMYDRRARIDQDAENLIAHELAHQWFGDLLTCRDWSHGWLNEGFATFFEQVWAEHFKGPDEWRYLLQNEIDGYLREASTNYRRPIVCNVYHSPIDLFDRHLYEKGGIVLNMLRRLLGDELFWKAIRRYALTHRGTNVVTPDLQKAIEDATGRNLDWFFDQWVYGAGHPELKAEFTWDEERKQAKVSFKQTQEGEQVAKAFRLPLNIDFRPDAGERQAFRVEMTEREQAFYFTLAAKPKLVRIDPGADVLKALDFQRSGEMLREQLANDEDVLGRIDAARALGKKGDPEAIAALGLAVRDDGFWGVQAEAARALGGIRATAAMDELLAAIHVSHAKARRAVLTALGEFRDERAAEALEEVLDNGDESYYAEAAAAAAIGKTRSTRAFAALERALRKDSMNDVIRGSAFNGFAELKDERAVEIAMDWSRYGRPGSVRGAAISALGKLGGVVSDARKAEIVDHLIPLLDDRWFRAQQAAIGALDDLKDARAVPQLDRLARGALDGRVVRLAREAGGRIRRGQDKGEEVKKLREEVDKLADENKALRDRLDKIEASMKPNGGQ